MGCCKCSCTKKLKHVDQVIHDYDPQENFLNYDVTTVWINRKTKRAWLLVSKEGGIAVWQPIPLEQSAIDNIILDCGEVTPNENGEIIHEATCGARTVAKDCTDMCITIETDWGLTGGGNVCTGEKLTLSIDKANTNLVTSSSTGVKDGDSVVFDGDSGKIIKRAMNWRVGDGTDSWTGRFNPETKGLDFFPNDKNTDPLLSMLPNGVILGSFQPKASARLTQNSPIFDKNAYYKIGSNIAFEKIRDEDGYNKSANNLFLGGTGSYLYYKTPYPGTWGVIYKFVIDQGRLASGTRIVSRVNFGPENRLQQLKTEEHYPNASYKTISDTIFLPMNKDDIIFIEVLIESDQGDPYVKSAAVLNEIDNYFGCFLTLG